MRKNTLNRKHRQIILVAVLCVFYLLGGRADSVRAQNAGSGTSGGTVELNAKIETFQEIWKIINEKYYDARFNGVDWKSIGERYRQQIEKTSGEKDFYALLDQMVGELHDSHTRVFSPFARAQRANRRKTETGIVIRNVENQPAIVSVEAGSSAAQTGIEPGMIVRRIDDQPVEDVIAAARQTIGASSSERATEMRVFSKILSGEPESALTLELLRPDKSVFRAIVRRSVNVSAAAPVEARTLASGYAYLKIRRFDETVIAPVKDALRRFRNAPALILDLRGNPGGDGESGLQIAEFFVERKITVAHLITRSGKPPLPEMPMTLQIGGKNKPLYSRPVVILIDEGTASTAELIANALQEHKRARVVGRQSCGCVLGFLDYKKLKNGGELSLSEFGFITANGRKLEGNGVTPDIIAEIKLNDLRRNYDAALAAAENLLTQIRRKK